MVMDVYIIKREKLNYKGVEMGDLVWKVVYTIHGDCHEGLDGVLFVPFNGNSRETWEMILVEKGYDVKTISLAVYG